MGTPKNLSVMENNTSENPSSIMTTINTKQLKNDPLSANSTRRMRNSTNNYQRVSRNKNSALKENDDLRDFLSIP